MKRLTTLVFFFFVSVSLVGALFGQGGAEELPLAEQKAFQAKQAATGNQPQPSQGQPQQAPPSDQQVPLQDQASPSAISPAAPGDQKAPQLSAPKVEPKQSGKATLYIYRTSFNYLALVDMSSLILAKDGPIGRLPGGSYYTYVADPGTIWLWNVSLETADLQVEAIAGQAYYIEAGFQIAFGRPTPQPFLRLVASEKGMSEIAKCRSLSE